MYPKYGRFPWLTLQGYPGSYRRSNGAPLLANGLSDDYEEYKENKKNERAQSPSSGAAKP